MSRLQDFSQWKELLEVTFKRKHVKKWREMTLDILVVDSGFKPGLLWDYGKLNIESMEQLLQNAKQKFLLKNTLCVVTIEMDYMILNLDSLRGDHSVSCLDNMKVVDVSFELQQPEAMDDKSRLQTTYEEYKHIIDDRKNGTCLLQNIFNPSSLFGLLLGFPVIYWYSMEDEASGNCLSCQPLTVYRVVGCCHDNLREQLKMTSHVVYSFSVPVCVSGTYSQYITHWFQRLVETGRWSQWFDDIRLEVDTVTQPSVCL
ncbi:UPF0739 protein C1orf74 homolog [Haliotis rubra]|uniref:UPF0739 protein C1orf74 homolog n=1 Tax=Haliotis rubra TaxID=36100 RepID=UPI001EE5DCAC|nr:UPF0739 protein C1orf74 homolog [Haliotis rubra]XP_046575956.1 UPF0739 protein C1orf74 homolog [Haliotis rubra]